jgi:acetate kinase
MRVLTVNVGSTSIKLRVVGENDRVDASVDLSLGSLGDALNGLGPFDAIGHRIVHGGQTFTTPVLLTDAVVAELRGLEDLAPLHQAPALEAVDVISRARPHTPAVACFDTAFHSTLPPAASTYAIPERWRAFGARRYGFHGLSHAWSSRRAREMNGAAERVVTCHLGGGGSLAAIAAGVCMDTTMGFTPLDGLVMTTRSGSIDPGLVLWLQQHRGLTAEEVGGELEHSSGLLGLCGTTDMREVTARADAGDESATLALDVYVHSLRAGIAAMAAALGGIDTLVFTGGIGEGSPTVRASACAGLRFLGIEVEVDANTASGGDRCISPAEAAVCVLIIEAREDLEISAGVRTVLRA